MLVVRRWRQIRDSRRRGNLRDGTFPKIVCQSGVVLPFAHVARALLQPMASGHGRERRRKPAVPCLTPRRASPALSHRDE